MIKDCLVHPSCYTVSLCWLSVSYRLVCIGWSKPRNISCPPPFSLVTVKFVSEVWMFVSFLQISALVSIFFNLFHLQVISYYIFLWITHLLKLCTSPWSEVAQLCQTLCNPVDCRLLQIASFCMFFHGWVLFDSVHVSVVYPLICLWAFRWPPWLGCCK